MKKQTIGQKTGLKADDLTSIEYEDVTNERLKKLYPTKDWPYRYSRAVWGGR